MDDFLNELVILWRSGRDEGKLGKKVRSEVGIRVLIMYSVSLGTSCRTCNSDMPIAKDELMSHGYTDQSETCQDNCDLVALHYCSVPSFSQHCLAYFDHCG